jgi:hypothetical protein
MPRIRLRPEGYTLADGEDYPIARLRTAAPHLFDVLGLPLVDGRDFTDQDTATSEPVAIVSQSFAQRVFPNGDAVNRKLWWNDADARLFGHDAPRRIVGVVGDMDDEHLLSAPAPTLYEPVRQIGFAGRLFVRTAADPYALVPAVVRAIRHIAPDQPLERAATLEDIRADVLSPNRLNAFVFSTFAAIALLIAIVGVAGVLAFSVGARTREFGIRLAVGSAPRQLLARVLAEGTRIAGIGIAAGAIGGYVLVRAAATVIGQTEWPGAVPLAIAALTLAAAAVLASLVPAARAARIDVLQALRSE